MSRGKTCAALLEGPGGCSHRRKASKRRLTRQDFAAVLRIQVSGGRMRLACWRARARDRELFSEPYVTTEKERLFRRDAETNTRDARAPQMRGSRSTTAHILRRQRVRRVDALELRQRNAVSR
jgi:hypothetical protein